MIKKNILFISIIVLLISSFFVGKVIMNKKSIRNKDTNSDTNLIEIKPIDFKLENMGDGYFQDEKYIYENGKKIFDLSEGDSPFKKAALELEKHFPRDDSAIDVIVASYYDLILHYGNYSKFSIFNNLNLLSSFDFFTPYYQNLTSDNLKGFDQKITAFPAFKLAFFVEKSPGVSKDIISGGATMGGEVVGKKFIDNNTMLVYSKYETQDYLGPSAYECKQNGVAIDKFFFKKINNLWKIFDFEKDVDFWITTQGGDGEYCKEINQDRIKKYQISN